MINKISSVALFACCASVFAGGMGEVSSISPLTSFLSLEGGYSWNQIKGFNFDLIGVNGTVFSREKNNGGTARIGAGLMRSISDQFSLSTEIGYGYYGRTTENSVLTGLAAGFPASLSMKYTLTGLDVLAGVAFNDPINRYSLFFKAGGMVQNMNARSAADFGPFGIAPINIFNQSLNYTGNSTGVLPELKAGGAYYFNENWAFTLAYMYAFGASPRTTGTFNVNTNAGLLNANFQNPSLSSVLAGLQFRV